MDPTKKGIKLCADLGKGLTETCAKIRQEERKRGRYTESSNSPRPKKGRQMKSKVKSMLIAFFDMKAIVHKDFILEDQTVNFAYFCDVFRRLQENVRRLRP
jgi:hypothetical protein